MKDPKSLVTGATKCLLVRPEFLDTFYNLSDVFELMNAKSAAPPLGALVVASLLPDEWDLKFIDADVDPLTDEHFDWADIVMVSGIGPQEETIMRIVDRAHAKGKPVVVGGAGPTLQAEVYVGRADYVVSGEAEDTLPILLDDLRAGKTEGLYRSNRRADITNRPVPRYDLARLDQYLFVGVGYSRGCPFACEFCAQIEIFGRHPRTKKTDQTLAELQAIYDLGYRGQIDFGYDNLIGDIPQVTDMLTAMRDWSKARGYPFHYSTEATMNLARQPKVLELMHDNDFRMVFIGIESGDDDVLEQTKKGQNTAMPAAEAVRVVNQHGMIVYTGLILGFDGEKSSTAKNMVQMVQDTGAFPSLVLPLHALPSTQLSKRMHEEGRLFDGKMLMNTSSRTDTATTGLNFVTQRPRVEIMRDLEWVLTQIYEPKNHYDRVTYTAKQLRPANLYKPSWGEIWLMAKAFMKISVRIGMSPKTGWYFWKSLLTIMFTNFPAVAVVVILAVLHENYFNQAQTYIEALHKQIALVQSMGGEQKFNAQMVGGHAEEFAQTAKSA